MVSERMASRSFWWLALLIGCSGNARPVNVATTSKADLVFLNGDVFVPGGHKTSIAIQGDRIVAIDDTERWIHSGTRVYDLGGKSVVVGLSDAHCHLYGLGVDMETVSLRKLGSEAEVVKVISDAAKSRPTSEW